MPIPFFIIKTGKSTKAEDGSQYTFIKPYKADVNQIVETFQSRMIDSLNKTDDNGIYTWIIKDDGTMYLSKTLSNQEIGSLHANLDIFTGDSNVVAAGELKRVGETIEYNLRSGTYMEHVITTNAIRNEKKTMMDNLISKAGFAPRFLKCKTDENGNGTEDCTEEYESLAGRTIIDGFSMVTSESEIELYKSLFTIKAMPTTVRGGARVSARASTKRRSRNKSIIRRMVSKLKSRI
jgi:hypothetical protein